MPTTLTALVTVEDYKVLPETGPRYQLVEGDLYMSPAPNRYHQDISRNIEFMILKWIETGGGGRIYYAPFDVYLDEVNVFQPDLVYISAENSGILTDIGAEGAPDLVVEILSPGTRRIDLGPKKKVFARHGVKELWIVDPEPRTIDRFVLEGEAFATAEQFSEADSFSSVILPGLTIVGTKVFEA
ncbi:MAG: Uma2 family endonuclease [Verrucomicrobia bacterium]|nr:Uma2 family endonuclease [Verrucomicrobiota bacterium]